MALAILVVQRSMRNILPENLQIEGTIEFKHVCSKSCFRFYVHRGLPCFQKAFLYINIIKLGSALEYKYAIGPPSPPKEKANPYEGV